MVQFFPSIINFTAFNALAEKVFSPFIALFKPSKFSRLGLRYINQIKIDQGNPFDWKNYIDPSLTYAVDKYLNNKSNLARAISQLIINENDYKIVFHYGFFNSEFPAKIVKKEFVLDFDCYTEDFNEKTIYKYVGVFNKEIKHLFERCIRDGLRKIMGVVNE